jgi:hypothetical protein
MGLVADPSAASGVCGGCCDCCGGCCDCCGGSRGLGGGLSPATSAEARTGAALGWMDLTGGGGGLVYNGAQEDNITYPRNGPSSGSLGKRPHPPVGVGCRVYPAGTVVGGRTRWGPGGGTTGTRRRLPMVMTSEKREE